jgi:hypothetical protein
MLVMTPFTVAVFDCNDCTNTLFVTRGSVPMEPSSAAPISENGIAQVATSIPSIVSVAMDEEEEEEEEEEEDDEEEDEDLRCCFAAASSCVGVGGSCCCCGGGRAGSSTFAASSSPAGTEGRRAVVASGFPVASDIVTG